MGRLGLREEEADDFFGGGGGGEEALTNQEDDVDDDDDLLEEDDDAIDDDDDSKTKGSSLSPDQIASLAAKTAAETMRGQPQAQPKTELTQAQIDQALGRFMVSEDFAKQLSDPDTPANKRAELLQQLVDNTMKYAFRTAQAYHEQQMGPVNQRLAAQDAYVREQKVGSFVSKVEKNFPALKGHGKLIRQTLEQLNAQGYDPKVAGHLSNSAIIKHVARSTAAVIKSISPTFSLKAGGQANRQAGSFGAQRNNGGRSQGAPGGSGVKSFTDLF